MHLIVPNLGYHPDHLGGACRYTTELCERLARRGHRIEAIYPATPEHPPGTEVRHCVVLHRHGNADGFFLGNWHAENRQARALIEQIFARAQKPPLLLLSHAYYWPAVAPYRQRTAFFIHGPWGREFRFSRQTRVRGWLKRCFDEVIARRLDAIERTALRRVRQVQTTSRYMMAQLPIWHGNFNTPVIGVGGGVNLVQFKPDPARQAYRREMGVGENDFVFLTVRRLDPRMGLLRCSKRSRWLRRICRKPDCGSPGAAPRKPPCAGGSKNLAWPAGSNCSASFRMKFCRVSSAPPIAP